MAPTLTVLRSSSVTPDFYQDPQAWESFWWPFSSFLRALYGRGPRGYLTVWTKQTCETKYFSPLGEEWFPLVGSYAAEASKTQDVYFGVGLRRDKLGRSSRGGNDDVSVVPAFWLDVDVAGITHAARDLPPSREAVLEFLAEFPLPPSALVDSGYGLHAYWLLTESWTLTTREERRKAQDLLRQFQAVFQRAAGRRGWSIDNTADLSRVLRLPGTRNHKGGYPVPVRLLELHTNRRYETADLERFVQSAPGGEQESSPLVEPAYPPAKIAPIVEDCSWLRHCRDDAATLAEPEWYAMLSVLSRCEGGERVAQEWSKPYPGYSERETADKLRHALSAAGPVTCGRVSDLTGGRWCSDCPQREKIKSPVNLGTPISADSTHVYKLLTLSDLASLPSPSWLIEGHLPEGRLAVLYGPPGAGKSFVALDWALSIAHGVDWLGISTKQGPVVYIAAEGSAGLWQRVRAWQKAHSVELSSKDVYFLAEAAQLMETQPVDKIIRTLSQLPQRPALVVFDTLARCMAGGEENSAKDVGRTISNVDRIRSEVGATVLLVHHTTKDGAAERGSSALRAAADTMISLTASDGTVVLCCDKQKDAAEFDRWYLKLTTVELGASDNLIPETSCVIERSTSEGVSERLTKGEQSILEALKVAGDEGCTATDLKEMTRFAKTTFYRALTNLKSRKYIDKRGQRYFFAPPEERG